MKFTNATLFLAAITPALAFTKVDIHVKCKGAKIDKLDLPDTTIVSHALEESYNDVHAALESDDSQLFDVHYGTWASAADFLQQGGGWGGGWDCRLCPDDDAMVALTGSGKAAWEMQFAQMLLESGKSAFAKVSSCSIDMKPHASTTEDELEDSFSDTKVIIEPRCSGINFGSLSVPLNVMAGKILEDAFNKAHADIDDSELIDVHWGGFRESSDVLQQGGGYGGGYDCRLCPDDDSMLSLSHNGQKAWEKEFIAGLAASGVKTFEKVSSCSITMKASSDEFDFTDHNVDINVKCSGGPNFNSLSISQSTYVAHSLQTSYNTVHDSASNDDSHLFDVFYHGPSTGQSGELMQGGGGYGGGYDCRLCPDDDASNLSIGTSGAELSAWENELVAELVRSGHPDFQRIRSCNIKMTPTAAGVTVEEGELSLTAAEELVADSAVTQVNIAVKCKGVKFDKLSIADDTFAGHILEDTYNKVHSESENDDSELTNVYYGRGYKFVGAGAEYLEQGGGGYGGGYDCRLCPDDDAMLAIGATGEAHSKWEEEFALGLAQSGRKDFKKVSECSIKMSAKDFAELLVEEPVKCGLRACADE